MVSKGMDPKEFVDSVEKRWKGMMMTTNQTRENVEAFIQQVFKQRNLMYVVGLRVPRPDGSEKQQAQGLLRREGLPCNLVLALG